MFTNYSSFAMWMTSDLAGKGQPGGVVAHEGEQGPVEETPLGHDGQTPGAVTGGVPLAYELQRRVPRQHVLQGIQTQNN